ncbi:MAG: hypothetical protein Q9223_006766 [Gallowayella weberi]
MFARASRTKFNHHASKQLHLSPNDFNLPWLCPILYTQKSRHRSSSISTPLHTVKPKRPLLPELKSPDPPLQTNTRRLASATAFDYLSSADDYVPFENKPPAQQLDPFQPPWLPNPNTVATHDTFDLDPPLVIKDSLSTRPPRFRSIDAIAGELGDVLKTMKACLHVGRFQRAAALMRRLNAIYKPDSPALLAAHNDYIRESVWKIASTRDQRLLNDLQTWFEVELRGRGIIPDATTYAFMIQASLQDIDMGRSHRSTRRYLHLAEEQGVRDELMNALLLVLNEQDVGRVTRVGCSSSSTSIFCS